MAKDQKQNRAKILKKLDEMKKYKLVIMPNVAGKSYRIAKVYGSSELIGGEKKKPNFLHDFVEASEMDASVEKGYKGAGLRALAHAVHERAVGRPHHAGRVADAVHAVRHCVRRFAFKA